MPRLRCERRAAPMIGKRESLRRVFPEQEVYERLRPIVLFGETAVSRAKETGVSERTLHYQADQFERYGMVSLFPKAPALTPDPGQLLQEGVRQLIVDLKAEHPAFRPREIARICFVRFGRKPSDHTVKRILAAGPPPSVTMRRYSLYAKTRRPLPTASSHCRFAAQGWSNTNIAALSTAGAPKGIGSRGGGIFYCNQAMDVYAALEITKERIEKRQTWQNDIESHFNIARKMADARFARAMSWEEVLTIHRRGSRAITMCSAIGRMNSARKAATAPWRCSIGTKARCIRPQCSTASCSPPATPASLPTHGLQRFQNWKLYAERGLPKAPVTVWVYEGSRHRSSTRP